MKKIMTALLAAAMMITALTGCTAQKGTESSSSSEQAFNTNKSITVISREDGSGTRGAFIELFEIEKKDANGNKKDCTTEEATIANTTSVMMTTVAENPYAIGYISLGSMNDTVKALKIDGADATVANIKSGSYKIARPFNIATKETVNAQTQDFINFIMSSEGQKIVEEAGYISSVENATAFQPNGASGKVVVAGSSSVTPAMEKLKEAYMKMNSTVEIDIQQSDSTTGMTQTKEGTCDIGMASRDLKDSEISVGLKPSVIAMDGIAVVVNKANTTENLTADQILKIFTGDTTKWSELAK